MTRSLFSLILFALTVQHATAATVSAELSPTQQVAYENVITPIPAVVLIKRGASDSVASNLVVNFSVGGTAIQTTDFLLTGTTTSTSITILAGQQSASLTITPVDDLTPEGQETVVIQLTTGNGYTLAAQNSVDVPITDDDVSVSLLTPKPLAYEDYTTGPGTTLDPDVNRRGVFRTTVTPARTFNTYVISELSAGGTVGAAQLGTDYTVTYKIGGNGMGEGRGYTIQPRYAYLAGATQIQITGGSANIPANAIITINTVSYSTIAGLAATSGTLTISPALIDPVENGTSLTVNGVNTGFFINQANNWEPADVTTLIVDNGIGGFAPGDVFRIGTQTTPQYLVNAWDSVTGTLSFTTFTGTGGATGGLATDLSGNLEIVTHFPAVFSGIGARQIQVLVPGTSTRLEYGITPLSDTLAEASEALTINLLTSNDYRTVSPTTGQITITDDDVVISFEPTQSVNATEGGTNGSFRVVLSSAFPRTVDLAYTISGTATATTDYVPLTGTVSIPAGSVTGTITVIAADDSTPESPAETVVLTLQSTKDYRVVTTSGANANASAEITINDKVGVVSIETVSGQTTGRENPTSVTTAAMTVTLRNPTTLLPITEPTGLSAITVGYSISGTASNGSDYQTLTGSVVIPAGLNHATITVTPIDDIAPETSESVILTLSPGEGYTVSNTAGTATVSIADDEPTVGIVKAPDAAEGGSNGVFTVGYLPPALNRDITVDLTYSGTATTGDYTSSASSGTPTAVIIKAGEFSSTVTIAAIDDTTPEGTETVIATITPKPAIYTVGVASATMNITDNEPVLKMIKVTDTTEDGTTAGSFRVFYESAVVARDIIVNLSYPTTTATAKAADFASALPTTVTILTGTRTITFTTPLAVYDGVTEGNETLECKIDANASSYTVDSTSGSATLTIADKIPTFTMSSNLDALEGSTTNKGVFVITSSFAPLLPLTVPYTITGTATPGATADGTNDYKTLSGTVQVSGLTTNIEVEAFGDSTFDPFESVIVTLTDQTPKVFEHAGTAPLSEVLYITDALVKVFSVTSTAANNTTLTLGNTAQIEVLFSQSLAVTGSPTLTIETGLNDTVATYSGISSDRYSLFFTYTVRGVDNSANMEYSGTNALSFNGGTIVNLVGTPATLTLPSPGTDGSLGFNRTRPINGGLDGGKPAPGTVGSASGGGCGLGSGFAALASLSMLAGMMVSIRRIRR
jgi:Calx-beta domain